MRIEDCITTGNLAAVTAAFTRTEPEAEWVRARDACIIPMKVYSLYQRAGFLSFGSSPPFLSDENQSLFGYFSMILESIKDTLVDADVQVEGFVKAQSEIWDVGKEHRGESFDPKANDSARNHFRLLILSLCASLDATAEITALLLTDQINGLRVGRAEFQKIEDWLDQRLPMQAGVIVTPQWIKLEMLHQKLRPIVKATGPESDWLPLMRLFRNKAAHLGTSHFREMGFHDETLRFYRFFPRQWPVLWEEHEHSTLGAMLAQFMRQDNVSYVHALRAKVTVLIEAAFEILDSTYTEFQNFPVNNAALQQLQKNSKSFAFERFEESA